YALAGIFASTGYKEYPQAPADVVARYDAAQATIDQKSLELKKRRRAVTEAESDADKESAQAAVKALQSEINQLKNELPPKCPVIHGLTEGKTIANMRVHLRGNPATLGTEAPRRFLAVLASEEEQEPAPFAEGSGRLALARAIASPDNPLTARVLVNRVWVYHFGQGLVRTPSDFGIRSDPPTHPEILDWLARRFGEGGWSLKKLHQSVLRSAADP